MSLSSAYFSRILPFHYSLFHFFNALLLAYPNHLFSSATRSHRSFRRGLDDPPYLPPSLLFLLPVFLPFHRSFFPAPLITRPRYALSVLLRLSVAYIARPYDSRRGTERTVPPFFLSFFDKRLWR